MARVENDRDMVVKNVVPAVTETTTNPTTGGAVGACIHTVGNNKKAHVIGITISGSAAGAFYLNIDGLNVYTLRVAANGMIRVLFHYNTFVGTEGEVIRITSATDLTGQYEACMEIYEEPTVD